MFPPRYTRRHAACIVAKVDDESRRQYAGGEDETVVTWHQDERGEEGSFAFSEAPSRTRGGLTWVINEFDQCRQCALREGGLTLGRRL